MFGSTATASRASAPAGGNAAGDAASSARIETLDATGLMRRAGIHRSALPPARAGRRIFGNDRDRNARGGARRLHRRLPHAQYAAGERQRFGDARDPGTRRRSGSTRVWPIGAASPGSKGEALAEIAAMQKAGIVARERRRQAHRHGQAAAPGDGLLPRAGSAGDRSLRGRLAVCRRGHARGTPVGAARPARHACGHRIHRRVPRRSESRS